MPAPNSTACVTRRYCAVTAQSRPFVALLGGRTVLVSNVAAGNAAAHHPRCHEKAERFHGHSGHRENSFFHGGENCRAPCMRKIWQQCARARREFPTTRPSHKVRQALYTDAAALGKQSAVSADADRVDDLGHSRGLVCDRFRKLALQIGIDQTIEIHHPIQSLHAQQIGRFQCRMLLEQPLHIRGDLRIARATAKSAFIKCRAASDRTRQDQRGSQRSTASTGSNSARVHGCHV